MENKNANHLPGSSSMLLRALQWLLLVWHGHHRGPWNCECYRCKAWREDRHREEIRAAQEQAAEARRASAYWEGLELYRPPPTSLPSSGTKVLL